MYAYLYAIIRVVPSVERGECINVGIVLFARGPRHLAAAVETDRTRLQALAPTLDVDTVGRHLEAFVAITRGERSGGPLADLPAAERFHWLTAPRSTIIQTAPAHVGQAADLPAELDRLMDAYVRRPASP